MVSERQSRTPNLANKLYGGHAILFYRNFRWTLVKKWNERRPANRLIFGKRFHAEGKLRVRSVGDLSVDRTK